MSTSKAWISACRPKTLPLALSGIILGSILSYADSTPEYPFDWKIFAFAILTASFLQILSNLANDYGDAVSGADEDRIGPARAVQSGAITKVKMKSAIMLLIALSLISGVALLYFSIWPLNIKFVLFFILGTLAIGAAIKYTMGKNPYGYRALGDLFVFIFFGLVSVVGVYYLHNKNIDPLILLPASTVGLFSVGVLNLNNMRDIEGDRKVGKNTLAVTLGLDNAKKYHSILIIGGLLLALTYIFILNRVPYGLLFCALIPLYVLHLIRTNKNSGIAIEPELKKLALLTFFFSIIFGIGCAL